MRLPDSLEKLFHNYRAESIDVRTDVDFVVKTVLRDATDWEQVRVLFDLYGWDRIKEVVLSDFRGRRELPEPVLRLWMIAFAPDEWAEEERWVAGLSGRERFVWEWGIRRTG